jgi:glycosyltransferase involved in cell wall biosynthesis
MTKKKRVEIVIPIYNEEEELKVNVLKLHSFLKKYCKNYIWGIVIADNASTDTSFAIARSLVKKYKEIKAIHLDKKGRGRAVKKIWLESKADILVYMDVDLSTDLNNLIPLINSLARDYDIAIGSRLLGKSKVVNRPLNREILSRGYNILMKIMLNTKFSDAQCGFKGITKETAKNLLPHIKDNAWFFDSEMLIVGEKLGYKIYEEPVKWVDNPGSTVRVMGTVKGDLDGLWRLFYSRPWKQLRRKDE